MKSNAAPIRIPKPQETHPKLGFFAAIYGFGIFTRCVPEGDALSKQPKPEKEEAKTRDLSRIIKLPVTWSFRLDCEHTFTEQAVEWSCLEELTQIPSAAIQRRSAEGARLLLGTAHQGLHKNLAVDVARSPLADTKEKTRVQVEIDYNGVHYPSIGGVTQHLLSDEQLPIVINALWDAPGARAD